MKKVFALLLGATMFTACTSDEKKIEGTWTIDKYEFTGGGKTLDLMSTSSSCNASTMDFKEGKVTNILNVDMFGTGCESDTTISEYTIADDKLTLTDGSGTASSLNVDELKSSSMILTGSDTDGTFVIELSK